VCLIIPLLSSILLLWVSIGLHQRWLLFKLFGFNLLFGFVYMYLLILP
jgi:hypothetical protein